MKTIFISLIICLTAANAAADDKDYYSHIDPKVRNQLISTMRVKSESASGQRELDIPQYLSEKCGFTYKRDPSGNPVRPEVFCVYKPRGEGDDFSGMSSKFDCTFSFQDELGHLKEKTLKVKYDAAKHEGGGYKEIPQAVMGTLMARLLGFYSGTYCPVDLTCKDCPNDNPWSSKAKAAAVSGNVITFKNVVVEVKQKGFKIIDSRHVNDEKPQGFSFSEINRNISKNNTALLRSERDALTLWMNFVLSQDADHHNNKMFCLKSSPLEGGSAPVCEQAIGIINDYGNSFGYSGSDTKLSLRKFSSDALRSSGLTTGASGNAGASMHAVSSSGRDSFVASAEAITEKQLDDILALAQIEKVSDASATDWKIVFRQKVQRLKAIRIR